MAQSDFVRATRRRNKPGVGTNGNSHSRVPLTDIFSNMGDADLNAVTDAARSQSTSTPAYKSNGVETRYYDGYFKAASDTTKLAVLSDDGTSLWIDDQSVLSRAGNNQGFDQDFDSTFSPINPGTPLLKDHIYHLRVQYTNTIHRESDDTEVDGVTLFAYDGGGQIVTVSWLADPTPSISAWIGSPANYTQVHPNQKITLTIPTIKDLDTKVVSDGTKTLEADDITVTWDSGGLGSFSTPLNSKNPDGTIKSQVE